MESTTTTNVRPKLTKRTAACGRDKIFESILPNGRRAAVQFNDREAWLCEGEDVICEMTFTNCARHRIHKICSKELYGLVSSIGHNRRYKANRRARLAAEAAAAACEVIY